MGLARTCGTADKFIENIADAEAELSKSIRDAGAEI
jgi:hypothetical protein